MAEANQRIRNSYGITLASTSELIRKFVDAQGDPNTPIHVKIGTDGGRQTIYFASTVPIRDLERPHAIGGFQIQWNINDPLVAENSFQYSMNELGTYWQTLYGVRNGQAWNTGHWYRYGRGGMQNPDQIVEAHFGDVEGVQTIVQMINAGGARYTTLTPSEIVYMLSCYDQRFILNGVEIAKSLNTPAGQGEDGDYRILNIRDIRAHPLQNAAVKLFGGRPYFYYLMDKHRELPHVVLKNHAVPRHGVPHESILKREVDARYREDMLLDRRGLERVGAKTMYQLDQTRQWGLGGWRYELRQIDGPSWNLVIDQRSISEDRIAQKVRTYKDSIQDIRTVHTTDGRRVRNIRANKLEPGTCIGMVQTRPKSTYASINAFLLNRDSNSLWTRNQLTIIKNGVDIGSLGIEPTTLIQPGQRIEHVPVQRANLAFKLLSDFQYQGKTYGYAGSNFTIEQLMEYSELGIPIFGFARMFKNHDGRIYNTTRLPWWSQFRQNATTRSTILIEISSKTKRKAVETIGVMEVTEKNMDSAICMVTPFEKKVRYIGSTNLAFMTRFWNRDNLEEFRPIVGDEIIDEALGYWDFAKGHNIQVPGALNGRDVLLDVVKAMRPGWEGAKALGDKYIAPPRLAGFACMASTDLLSLTRAQRAEVMANWAGRQIRADFAVMRKDPIAVQPGQMVDLT